MDRGGLAYLQDLFFLMVATMAVTMLLIDLSSMYLARQELERQNELEVETSRLCDAIPYYSKVLHDHRLGLLDRAALDALGLADLKSDLRITGGFSVTIEAATDGEVGIREGWVWSSGIPPKERGSCVTSCAIWFDGGNVRPARVTALSWRA